jgi:class 3 adenylate cyclase
MIFGRDARQTRPIVEWFAEIDNWPTSRKTVWLSGWAFISHVGVGVVVATCLNVWGGVDMGRLMLIMGASLVILGVTFVVSVLALRNGGDGRWTAYVLIFGYGAWNTVFLQAFGSWSTPFFVFYPLVVVLVALYFGERLGWFAFAVGAVMFGAREALETGGALDYAPVLLDRSIDSQYNGFWVAANAFAVMSLFVFCFVISTLVVAARRLQDQKLRAAHAQIQRSNELIARYAPRQVAERILTGEHDADYRPERLKLTIVFSDVVGFTDSSDEMDPEDLADFLNDYLAKMSDIADRHGATINQFLGDGIMIFFGAPQATSERDDARRAVQMALEMQDSMAGLNEAWLQRGGRRTFEVRIGINTGYASVGDYGSPGRKAYSAIGVQVNLAARIEAQCQPGKVLVSDTTWALVRDAFIGTDMGEVELKGIHFPVRVYEIETAANVTPASF